MNNEEHGPRRRMWPRSVLSSVIVSAWLGATLTPVAAPTASGVTSSRGCPWDISGGDGTVDVNDLVLLLCDWGPCPGCVPDLDGNGVVDVGDLLQVLAHWGPC